MPRLAPKELKLEAKEREHLEKLINRHTTEQQIALRAKIVLLADEGENNREIARACHQSGQTHLNSRLLI